MSERVRAHTPHQQVTFMLRDDTVLDKMSRQISAITEGRRTSGLFHTFYYDATTSVSLGVALLDPERSTVIILHFNLTFLRLPQKQDEEVGIQSVSVCETNEAVVLVLMFLQLSDLSQRTST